MWFLSVLHFLTIHFSCQFSNLSIFISAPDSFASYNSLLKFRLVPYQIGDLGLSKIKQKTLISGGVRGTIPWMAPELLNSKNMVTEKVG